MRFSKREIDIVAATLGFAIAFGCCLPFLRGREYADPEVEIPKRRLRTSIELPVANDLPLQEALQTAAVIEEERDIEQLLAFDRNAAELNGKEREALLAQLMKLPEEERRSRLKILLLRWAESDPSATVLWCREKLQGKERSAHIRGILSTWVHQDVESCVDWWVSNTPERQIFDPTLIQLISRTDVLAYARFLEHELRAMQINARIEPAAMPGSERLSELAEAVIGKVGYKPRRPNDLPSEARLLHLHGKSGWNALFENVAVAWHAESPEECEAWLERFPEEAQSAARSRISTAQKEGVKKEGVRDPMGQTPN